MENIFSQIKMVDPKILRIDEDQPRENLDQGQINNLVRKMSAEGFDPKKFIEAWEDTQVVIHGNHRTISAVEAQIPLVPVLFRKREQESPEAEAMLRLEQCADNMGKNMKPMELVETAEKAIAAGLPLEDVAGKLGKSVQSIVKDRILFDAPGPIKEELQIGQISKQLAIALAEICKNRLENGKSVNATKLVAKAKAGGKNFDVQVKAANKYITEVNTSNKARDQKSMFKDQQETEETKKIDKNFICVDGKKDFTVKNLRSLVNGVQKNTRKYLESPGANGHRTALTRVMSQFELNALVTDVKKLYDVLNDVNNYAKASNA
jgi:ParB-like chromosome segregation protein Spo0J